MPAAGAGVILDHDHVATMHDRPAVGIAPPDAGLPDRDMVGEQPRAEGCALQPARGIVDAKINGAPWRGLLFVGVFRFGRRLFLRKVVSQPAIVAAK